MKLRDFFPISFPVTPGEAKTLIVSLWKYCILLIAVAAIAFLFGWVAFTGMIIDAIAGLAAIYFIAGIVVSFLIYFRVI